MSEKYSISIWNRISRSVLLKAFRFLFDILADVRCSGLEKIPVGSTYLIVFNHVSLMEAPILVSYLPEHPEILGAVEVWNRPGQDLLAKAYGGIPIHRGEVDRNAMRKMLQVIEAGKPLMVAPEGGRSHQPGMRAGKPGIIFVTEKFSIPVVPIGMIGTTDDFLPNLLKLKKPTVEVIVGEPFLIPEDLGQGESRSVSYQKKVDYVMYKIADLLPEEYRGVYR